MGAPVQGLGDCRRFGVGGVDRHRPSVAGRPTREPVHAESRRRGNNGVVVSRLAVTESDVATQRRVADLAYRRLDRHEWLKMRPRRPWVRSAVVQCRTRVTNDFLRCNGSLAFMYGLSVNDCQHSSSAFRGQPFGLGSKDFVKGVASARLPTKLLAGLRCG